MNPTNDERARFEAAMAGKNFGASFERRTDGEYLFSNTEFAWRAWLARSQSAPAAQGEATCQYCAGSGEKTALEGGGPDASEVPIDCPKCAGTGAQGGALQSDYTALERKCQELERERDELREWNAQLDAAVTKLSLERDDAQAELTRLRAVEAAALKLVNGKGRFHTEQNYAALAEACGRKG